MSGDEGKTSQKKVSNHTNLMMWDVIVQLLTEPEIAETEIVETDVVETEAVVTEVVLIELVVVQLEFALLSGNVPQWGPSGHSPLPAM